jgi:single-strand DNA-binding protein
MFSFDGLNKTTISGRAGGAPEFRTTPGGTEVANFSVCVNGSKKVGETWEKTQTWYQVAAWAKDVPQIRRFVKKGTLLYIEGVVSASPFIDKNTGEARASLRLSARYIVPMANQRQENESANQSDDNAPPPGFVEEDDIPF